MGRFQQCAECVVAVADFPVVLHPNQGDNIPMCIVEVIISFLPRGLHLFPSVIVLGVIGKGD